MSLFCGIGEAMGIILWLYHRAIVLSVLVTMFFDSKECHCYLEDLVVTLKSAITICFGEQFFLYFERAFTMLYLARHSWVQRERGANP